MGKIIKMPFFWAVKDRLILISLYPYGVHLYINGREMSSLLIQSHKTSKYIYIYNSKKSLKLRDLLSN